ncbi:MAG: outer membrane beta-barrel protein [Acidobacteria bacterium]|nr:outer membrane beta-barrel protein [Acidobacteriota bacterium]
MMKYLLSAMAAVLLLPFAASAQDYPRAEIFGGYQFLREVGTEGTGTLNYHGFLTAVEVNAHSNFGIVGEFGLGFADAGQDLTESPAEITLKQFVFMGGPRVSYRSDAVRVFGHALFGADRFSTGAAFSGISENASLTPFMMAFGGGIDFVVNDRISVRPAQIDYVTSRLSFEGVTGWMKQIRYSGGLIFKFGGDGY